MLKRTISMMDMMTSWTGLVVPRTTPKVMRTAAVAKSALSKVTMLMSIQGQLGEQFEL